MLFSSCELNLNSFSPWQNVISANTHLSGVLQPWCSWRMGHCFRWTAVVIASEAAEWRGGDCLVLVAVKSESLVWVAADYLSVSGSSVLPQHWWEPDLCQGLVNQPVITAVHCLARRMPQRWPQPNYRSQLVWFPRQKVKISDFLHRVWGAPSPDSLLVNKTSIKQTICQMNRWWVSEWQKRSRRHRKRDLWQQIFHT